MLICVGCNHWSNIHGDKPSCSSHIDDLRSMRLREAEPRTELAGGECERPQSHGCQVSAERYHCHDPGGGVDQGELKGGDRNGDGSNAPGRLGEKFRDANQECNIRRYRTADERKTIQPR